MVSLACLGFVAVLVAAPQQPPPKSQEKPPLASPPAAQAADVASPEAVVDALYATISGPAGQKRDWQRLRSLFAADGRMVAMVKGREGGMRPFVLTVDDYVQRAGASLERDGFFEVEIARRVQRFGDIAHVFSTYEGKKKADDATPFLRGINSIQLVRGGERWAVLQILWEQEHDAGPIPEEFLVAADAKPAEAAKALPEMQLRIAGSDMLLELMADWIAGCRDDATLKASGSGGGTGAGFARFAVGEADLTLASRRISDRELAQARGSGAEPLEVCIGWSVSAIAVHPDNPIAALDGAQLRAIVAGDDQGKRWSQFGVKMPDGVGDDIAIAQAGGPLGSFALRHALFEGRERRRLEHLTGEELDAFAAHRDVLLVTSPACTAGLRVVPIAAEPGGAPVRPDATTCRDGTYPLASPCYVYYRDEPSGRIKRFVRWLESDAGKALLREHAIVPAR